MNSVIFTSKIKNDFANLKDFISENIKSYLEKNEVVVTFKRKKDKKLFMKEMADSNENVSFSNFKAFKQDSIMGKIIALRFLTADDTIVSKDNLKITFYKKDDCLEFAQCIFSEFIKVHPDIKANCEIYITDEDGMHKYNLNSKDLVLYAKLF